MPNLFNHNLIKTHIQKHQIDSYDEKLKVIQGWKKSLQTVKGVNEKALQSAFLQGIFGKVLGYKCFGEADEWNLNIEVSTEVDATTPDGILGFYTAEASSTQVVIELKSPKHSLDKKQHRAGKDYGTPVEQAFSYVSKYDHCSWVIVSNMNEIRLYKLGRSQEYYESFFIDDLDQEEEFKKFHLLLCKENLIQKDGNSETHKLSERTKERIQDISVSFYNLYKNIRIQLFEELKASNPDYSQGLLVEKAQKFLDRIIFICFCEDIGLLPNDLLHQAIERGKNSFSDSEYVICEEIKGVFKAIDKGSERHNIPAYDGGLFAFDEVLDKLSIRNDFFDAIYDISAYDFGTDLDVNILGHIFEQSIADIEELKSDVQKEEYDPQKSRRKKEGIYYTPNYITKYIVENSLGKYLEDIRKELGEDDLPDIESAANVQTEGRYRKKIQKFYQDYEERVKQVRVLDPACGSGAFLNQAFDFLLEEYRWIHEKISELFEGQTTIFDSDTYQRSVLQDNLYGVDINEESVEITKLSLWLKTADSRKALPYLDDNIKCGNSLIDDPEVACDKAFDWNKEFTEIMESGGFDVVIGNPPYVQLSMEHISNKIKDYLIDEYKTSSGRLNTFGYFILKSIKLLRERGYLSFIIPNTLLSQEYYEYIRSYILNKTVIESITSYSGMPFGDAVVENITIVLKKHSKPYNNKISIIMHDGSSVNLLRKINQNTYNENYKFAFHITEDNLAKEILNNPDYYKAESICDINQGIALKYDRKKSIIYEELYNSDEPYYKLLDGRDIEKYQIKWNGKYLKYNVNRIHSCKRKDIFLTPEKLIFRRVSKDLIFAYDDNRHFCLNTLVVVNLKKKPAVTIPLKYLLVILNSRLLNYVYNEKFKSTKTVFSEIQARSIGKLPIAVTSDKGQHIFVRKADEIINTKNHYYNINKKSFFRTMYNYVSSTTGISLENIIVNSSFKNLIYKGNAKKISALTTSINDKVITIYSNKSSQGKHELLKFEIKDHYKRQYLKLFLENLTEEQLTEVNQYEGNIMDKVMQIRIPDYDKPHVIKRVVDEWNQLQREKAELEDKIERTDKEIDQMVYELYGLSDEEIKIVEENV